MVADRLIAAGHEAWFVGGCVRDHLLGRPVHDVDVATDAAPETVQQLFPMALMVGAQFGVVVVVTPDGHHVEVATFRSDGEYVDGRRPTGIRRATRVEDVQRRDFTINALLLDPRSGAIEDHVGGLADLDARILRVVGDPAQRLREDRLRVLRGLRFAAHLGLTWDPGSWSAAVATSLTGLSRERIWQEFDKATNPATPRPRHLVEAGHTAARWYRGLLDSGHRAEVDPELPTDPAIAEALDRMRPEDDPLLPWAICFHGASAATFQRLAKEPLPRERIRRLSWLCQTSAQAQPTTRVAQRRRWFQHPDAPVLARVIRCLERPLSAERWLAAERDGPPWISPVTANDLLALGLKPGPGFGARLRQLEDAALEDPTLTRDQLLQWARRELGREPSREPS